MKARLLICCSFLFSYCSLFGAEPFVTPSYVSQLEELAEVQKAAAAKNKGVTFFLMEPGST